MRSFALTLVAAAWLALLGDEAAALGLTRSVNAGHIGQPLNFAAFVRLDGDETLLRECVFADVTVGDRKWPSGQLTVTLETTSDPLERRVRVTSTALVDEPIVTVNVSVGCNGRLSRQFTEFVDPPALNLAQSSPPATLPPQQVEPQVAPIVEVARNTNPPAATSAPPPAPAATPAPVRRPAATEPSRARVAAAARPVREPRAARPQAQQRPRAPVAAAPRPANPSPRLRLDAPAIAPVQVAKGPPQPAPAATAGAAAAAAQAAAVAAPAASTPEAVDAVDAAASAVSTAISLANEQQQRIAALEDSLRRLRVEAQNTLGSVATLESRLAEAEAARYRNPVVFALAGLVALLLGLLALMWWRQRGASNEPKWWTPAPVAAPAVRTTLPPAPEADSGPPSMPPSGPPSMPPTQFRDSLLPGARTEGPQTDVFARRELSVEELIDLEQQADFFIVLGQDEAAIDLLMGHVRSTGGISPLPYLKLLEIYGRRGEREAWERIRERFNRRFNAYAPEWGSDLQAGRGLEQYPEVLSTLQAQWHRPAQAMLTMDSLIFRRDESAPTFELPAYRELLFVYSIARDLSQAGTEMPPVDLALPMADTMPMPQGDEDPVPTLTVVPDAYQPTDVRLFPVDIDLTEPTSGFGGLGDRKRF